MGTFQIDNTIKEQEKAVLIGLVSKDQDEEKTKEYLDELQFLAETAGAITVKRFWQKLPHPDIATYLGKGKIEEVANFVKENSIDLVLIDDEISPSQLRNIEKATKCKVLDRSMLILDIFAQRARTVQAKTQVELAQLQYMLPRLKGLWTHLDRVKGGIGMKGAGEKEIETDRRIAQTRIALLKKQLKEIDKQNETRRKHRSEMIRVALVGYTNVGKVVFNTVPFLLSDTVGFIRKLPHHLIESFKSTLDETLEADILLHVVDISHPAFEEQISVVNNILEELNANDKPTIVVFNKMDLYEQKNFDEFLPQDVRKSLLQELEQSWMAKTNDNAIFVSATANRNTAELREKIFRKVKELYLERYPYKAGYWSEYC
jgi:GTP-binding protein HflX